jgi:hypothetical protein
MRSSIYILILILAVSSCSSDEDNHKANSDLFGEWNWEETNGGIAFHLHATPESTGKTIALNLNDNYTYSISENGNEMTNGSFEIIMKKSIYSGEMERFLQLSADQYYTDVVVNGIIRAYDSEKLDISDNNYDGIGSGFKKVE